MQRSVSAAVLLGLLFVEVLSGSESDVVVYMDSDDDQMPTTAEFFYNGQSLGKGRTAMQKVNDRLRDVPPGTSIVWGPNYDRCGACGGSEPRNVAAYLYPDLWKELEAHVKQRKCYLSSNYPYPGPRPVKETFDKGTTVLQWSNYRGPSTPHSEVLYQLDGDYVGRGDKGFDVLLARLAKQPAGTKLVMPRYQVGGRRAYEALSEAERNQLEQSVRTAFPFLSRKGELKTVISQRKLALEFATVSRGRLKLVTPLDWDSADRDGVSFVRYGRIVRHDETPTKSDAIVAWEGGQPCEDDKACNPALTLNGQSVGTGVDGFSKIVAALEQLEPESVVRVHVCIRTQAPFLCPVVFENCRHFERTGFEPYVGLYPWLIDVAVKRNLRIEWLPDEGKSCGDCELNR